MQFVLTNRGVIEAKDVLPGDYLYEYGTSRRLNINYVEELKHQRVYDIRYTDGRMEKVAGDQKIFFNNRIYTPEELSGEMLNNIIPIKRHVCDYGKLYEDLYPDPYVAGALFIYGDLNDKYINLPVDRYEADDVLRYKYGITYANETSKTKKYYTYIGSNEKITWVDFFKDYNFFHKNRILSEPIVPKEYQYAAPADRIQFITGVFDIGYSPEDTPDTVSITHTDGFMVDIVQTILWSLGIMCNSWRRDDGKYQLDVLGPEEDYAGFFYNINFRSRMINNIAEVYKCNPTLELRIKSVTPSLLMSNERWYTFYTDQHNAIYYSNQYLPMVAE